MLAIEYESGGHMIAVIMLKIFLFFITRYAEKEPVKKQIEWRIHAFQQWR
jgi:hypothetical protein